MDVRSVLDVFLRLTHVFGGVLWVGFLFYFGFILGPAMAEVGPENQKRVFPSIMGRMTRWIRPIVMGTYATGLLLLGLVFHAGGMMFEEGFGWGPVSGIISLLPFLLFLPYDMLSKSSLGKNMPVMGIVLVAGSMLFVYAMTDLAHMTYRSAMIHVGVLYGTILAANVFMRILPAQRRILAAMKEGASPDPADFGSTQLRARHNIYLTLPLIWTMLNQHTVVPGASSPFWFLGVLMISVLFVASLYKGTVPKS